MDGCGNDVGVAGGAGLGGVEVCAAWAIDPVGTVATPALSAVAILLSLANGRLDRA